MRLTDKLLRDMISLAGLGAMTAEGDERDPTARAYGEEGRRVQQWASEQLRKREEKRNAKS